MTSKSEIRGVFIHSASYQLNPDWNLIMQTCKDYGANLIVFEAGQGSRIRPEVINPAAAAAHAQGLPFHALLDVLAWDLYDDATRCVDANLAPFNWACPTKIGTVSTIDAIITELLTCDIDGFMFDYTRYFETSQICYCLECKARFEEYLGETITDWPGDFAPGGLRHNEKMVWRVEPVNDLVTRIRNRLLATKPNLVISAAPFTLFGNSPIYRRYWIGQDTANWIGKDQLDFVAPQIYTRDVDAIPDYLNTSLKYFVGGTEGKIPLIPVLATIDGAGAVPVDIFKAEVDLVRSLGADGWLIFRYGGPGDGVGSGSPDIRAYLAALDMPPVFTLENIQVFPSETEATITWTTTLPATSRVEYNTSPMFIAILDAFYGDTEPFPYWDVDHVPGTIAEDGTPVTDHSITLTGLLSGTEYYFRVQSQDPSGIATSKASTFTTGLISAHLLTVNSNPTGIPFNITRLA